MIANLTCFPLQWVRKGYHNLITDTAPASSVGGFSKVDSIQNVFMLRSDLHDMWDNYEFSVNPDVSVFYHAISSPTPFRNLRIITVSRRSLMA